MGFDDYFVMHFFEAPPLDAVHLGAAHVTFLAGFAVASDDVVAHAGFASAVAGAVAGVAPFRMRLGDAAMLGPSGNMRVRLLEEVGEAGSGAAFHAALLGAGAPFGVLRQPEYAGAGFVPHVTVQDLAVGGEASLAGVFTVDSVHVVRNHGGFGRGRVETVAVHQLGSK